jgi:hypothetical protein
LIANAVIHYNILLLSRHPNSCAADPGRALAGRRVGYGAMQFISPDVGAAGPNDDI